MTLLSKCHSEVSESRERSYGRWSICESVRGSVREPVGEFDGRRRGEEDAASPGGDGRGVDHQALLHLAVRVLGAKVVPRGPLEPASRLNSIRRENSGCFQYIRFGLGKSSKSDSSTGLRGLSRALSIV